MISGFTATAYRETTLVLAAFCSSLSCGEGLCRHTLRFCVVSLEKVKASFANYIILFECIQQLFPLYLIFKLLPFHSNPLLRTCHFLHILNSCCQMYRQTFHPFLASVIFWGLQQQTISPHPYHLNTHHTLLYHP